MTRADAYARPDPEQLAARLDRIEADYRYRIAALGEDPDVGDVELAQAELRSAIATDPWSEWLLPFADLRHWRSEADRLREYLEDAPARRAWMLANGIPEHQLDFVTDAARADLRQAEAFVRRLTPKAGDLTVQMIADGYCRHIAEHGERPTQPVLAEALATSDSTIKRTLTKYGRRWPVLCGRGSCPVHPAILT